MNETEPGFRDQLLKAARVTPSMKIQYSKAIQRTIERIVARRFWLVLYMALSCLAVPIISGMALAFPPPGAPPIPWPVELVFVVVSLFSLGLAMAGVSYFRHRPPNPIPPNPSIDAMVKRVLPWVLLGSVVLAGLIGIASLVSVGISEPNQLLIWGAFYVFLMMLFSTQSAHNSEKRTRERLLEIEARLAELEARLNRDKPPPSQA